jgi:hypothetical protein
MLRTPIALVLLLAACQSTGTPDQRSLETAFSEGFAPPLELTTERMRLAPLDPSVNQLDYDACQASREHLSSTMQWGGWPWATMTPADNLVDLERHWKEFENHEAYAYTVLAPSGEPCIGCVYLNPDEDDPRGAVMAFWVTEPQLERELDHHLVETVLAEIERAWPVDFVAFPIPVQNPRGIELLTDLGLEVVQDNDRRRTFAWRR